MTHQQTVSRPGAAPERPAREDGASSRGPTVFVVDDDFSVCRALRNLLSSVGLKVATFSSAAEFLDSYNADDPGCLVLDVRMPGMSGLELQRTLRLRGIFLPIIMITGFGDVATAVRAMKDGAVDFLEKPFSEQLLLEHVQAALNRDQRQRDLRRQGASLEARLALLSGREREVMERVVAGMANKEIAADLGLSKKTVEVHRAHVMQKLKVDTLPELVSLVITARLRAAEAPAAPAAPSVPAAPSAPAQAAPPSAAATGPRAPAEAPAPPVAERAAPPPS